MTPLTLWLLRRAAVWYCRRAGFALVAESVADRAFQRLDPVRTAAVGRDGDVLVCTWAAFAEG